LAAAPSRAFACKACKQLLQRKKEVALHAKAVDLILHFKFHRLEKAYTAVQTDMAGKRVAVVVAAAYFLLFKRVKSADSIRRHRAARRSGSRLRIRQSFGNLQAELSRAEFTRAFRMTHSTFLALLRLLGDDLMRDIEMAARSSGGRVEPPIRLALTVRMLSGASYLDMMMLFKLASSTVYDVFHSTVASITKRVAMPGLSSAQSELHHLARGFTTSRQPPNPLYGCVGAIDGICIEIQMSTDREASTAARECTKYLPRRLSTLTIDSFTFLRNAPVVRPMGLRGSYLA
jgi:hypothetical protein